jgi:hypothetical protein
VYVSVSGAQNVFSIPLEVSYDPQHLQVVDVSNGGFLSQDRQSVALVTLSAKSAGESVMAISGLSVLDPAMQAASAVGGTALVKIIGNEAPEDKINPVGKSDQEKQKTDNKRTLGDPSAPSVAVKAEDSPASPAMSR